MEERPSTIDPNDVELEYSAFDFKAESVETLSPFEDLPPDSNDDNDLLTIDLTQPLSSNSSEQVTVNPETSTDTSSTTGTKSYDMQSVIEKAIDQNLIEPVEVLRFLQKQVVCGRELEISSSEESLEGEVNHITVDRNNILQSTFTELEYISNFKITFEVDFMGEESIDVDGPQKLTNGSD